MRALSLAEPDEERVRCGELRNIERIDDGEERLGQPGFRRTCGDLGNSNGGCGSLRILE